MIVARQFIAWLRSFSPSGTKSDNPFRDKTRQAPYGMNSRPFPRPRGARSTSYPLRGCNSDSAQYSNTPTLQHSDTPTLQHSNTPSLHHSITPTLHHSITPSLH